MKRAGLTLLAMLLVGGATAWWLVREPQVDEPRPQLQAAAPRAARQVKGANGTAAAIPLAQPEVAQASAAPPDDAARLRASNDYFEFASEMFAAAKQGDPSAQYYLSNALSYCESLYDWYFIVYGPNGAPRHRTLDEALQLTAERPVFKPDDVRDIQQRCQKLRKIQPPPFGTSQEWLVGALAANFPLAQVTSALGLALQGHERGDSDKALAAREEARRLAMEALRTKDPKVIARMGDVAANLAGDDAAAARKAQWAWPLAACLREKDCDSMTDWMHLYCNVDTQCQPFETPVDVIRRQAGNDYDEVERLAREINEKLDAGTLEEGDL